MIQTSFYVLFLCILYVYATSYQNPIIPNQNLPDPGAIFYEGDYYIVATSNLNTEEKIFPIHKSKDLSNWEYMTSVFTRSTKPSWTDIDFWAPEIHIVNSKFLIYYAAREKVQPRQLCIGIAIADSITGPYKDLGYPLVRNNSVGNIDATLLYTPDGNYLVWKEDGNGRSPPIPTDIWAQKLSSDGLKFAFDKKVSLLKNGSANAFYNNKYAIGVARSKNPLGPYEKHGDPILVGNQEWRGPGHCSVINIRDTDNLIMIYHAWYKGHEGGNNNRLAMLDIVKWDNNGWPVVNNGTPSIERHDIP